VGPRAGMDDVEKRKFLTLPGLELRPLGRPDPSQSLYRLRYPSYMDRTLLKGQKQSVLIPVHDMMITELPKLNTVNVKQLITGITLLNWFLCLQLNCKC
jgi:hypothetical protein